MISKKELLKITGISYGQLYRWKREGLIPEEWFQKISVSTGQETFFEETHILPRIQKILELKDSHSLEELKKILNPEIHEMAFTIRQLYQYDVFDTKLIKQLVDDEAILNSNEVVILYALSKVKRDITKSFFKLHFDLSLKDFTNFYFDNTKMALINERRDGYIVFYNDELLISDKNVTVTVYDLSLLRSEMLAIIKMNSYARKEEYQYD